MPSKQSTVRRPKTQPVTRIKPQLTHDEVQRVAEKLAAALEHDSADMALMTLLFDHLSEVRTENGDFYGSIHTIKTAMFSGTNEASDAQRRFERGAYANRATLLLWPYERKEAV